jgi:hypothetical protein
LGFLRSPRAEPHPTPGGKSRRARLRDFGQGHDSRAASADARHLARQRLSCLASLCSIGHQSCAKRANDRRATTAGLRPRTACFTGTAWPEKVSCPPSARTRNARPASISSRRPSSTCVHIVGETTWRRRNESELSCKSFGLLSWGASRVERRSTTRRRECPAGRDGCGARHRRNARSDARSQERRRRHAADARVRYVT